MDIIQATHPIQLAVCGGALIFDVIGLAWLNRFKASKTSKALKDRGADGGGGGGDSGSSWSWPVQRAAFWVQIAGTLGLGAWLDRRYPIHDLFSPVRNYCIAFPIGLLDFHFSDVRRVPLRALGGAALWCSTGVIRKALVGNFIGEGLTKIVTDLSPLSLAKEYFRFLGAVPFIGILSDLIFSPMHRLAHNKAVYHQHHKTHHEYTHRLTSLVLYYGNFLDDWLMPASTIVGGFVYVWFTAKLGFEDSALTNVSEMLLLVNTLFSHAHDLRCANLVLPFLPEGLNFAAYHRVHHLSPGNNFGLTRPSDLVWDRILGHKTILDFSPKLEKFQGEADSRVKRG